MTAPLRKVSEDKRYQLALKRVAGKTMGLGYWSALEYLKRTGGLTNKESVL